MFLQENERKFSLNLAKLFSINQGVSINYLGMRMITRTTAIMMMKKDGRSKSCNVTPCQGKPNNILFQCLFHRILFLFTVHGGLYNKV